MKKPTRFERAADRYYPGRPINAGFAIKLLRAEHRAIVRMVKDELAYRVERNRSPDEVTDVSGISACKALLAALARRAR